MQIQIEAGVEIPARELAGRNSASKLARRNCRKQACGKENGSKLHALQSFAPIAAGEASLRNL
jgi:hypothetical protein